MVKQFRYPTGGDYHQQAATIIAAETREEADALMRAQVGDEEFEARYGANAPQNGEIDYTVEVSEGPVTYDYGCDC